MKTLRNFVKAGQTEEREKRTRKISMPLQRYIPDTCDQRREPKPTTMWQNVKRKISFSVSQETDKIADTIDTKMQCTAAQNITNMQDTDVAESPRLRRVNSDVGEEDIVHFAIADDDAKLLRRVLEGSRVNVNYLRPPGIAPLHQACISGNLEIVEILVQNGANINVRNYKDLTPLQLANIHGHFDIAEYLLRMGSPVTDIKDGFQVDRRRRKRSWCLKLGSKQYTIACTKDEAKPEY